MYRVTVRLRKLPGMGGPSLHSGIFEHSFIQKVTQKNGLLFLDHKSGIIAYNLSDVVSYSQVITGGEQE